MPAPPPCYWELSNTVASNLTAGSHVRGWSLDALEDGDDAAAVRVFPYVRDGVMGMHVLAHLAAYRTTLRWDWSAGWRAWRELAPRITTQVRLPAWQRAHSVSGDASEGGGGDGVAVPHKPATAATYRATLNLATGYLSHALVHPVFFLTAGTPLYSFGAAHITASTRLLPDVFGAVRVLYDGARSGIQNADVLLVQHDCSYLYGGSMLARYSLRDGASLQVHVPVHPYLSVGVIGERRNFVAGVQARSPCGARMMLCGNVSAGTWTLNMIRNVNDIWKVTLSCSGACTRRASKTYAPRFGLQLTNQDMPDYDYD